MHATCRGGTYHFRGQLLEQLADQTARGLRVRDHGVQQLLQVFLQACGCTLRMVNSTLQSQSPLFSHMHMSHTQTAQQLSHRFNITIFI